ncbi:MAG TPA: type II toxin-antitoxin system VapC family toxin [Rhizomicrobium sp.]|nr:type II toxin-antitoxin system VapC family toxin [Rhizomicrobium sp.]
MRLLLDTNVLIPIARRNLDDLDDSIADAVSSATNVLFASVASLWEIAIKTRLGRLDSRIAPADLPAYLDSQGIRLFSIDAKHVLTDLNPIPPTRDPFDHLLLAQCEVEDLRLVTRDRALAKHPLAWRAR